MKLLLCLLLWYPSATFSADFDNEKLKQKLKEFGVDEAEAKAVMQRFKRLAPDVPDPSDKDYDENLKKFLTSGTDKTDKLARRLYLELVKGSSDPSDVRPKEEPKQDKKEGKKEGAPAPPEPGPGGSGAGGLEERRQTPTEPTGSAPGARARAVASKVDAEANPDDPRAQADWGQINYWQNDARNAFGPLYKAVTGGVRDPQVLTVYGHTAYELGDYGEAEKAGKIAWEMDPSNHDAEALYKLAKGRVSKAKLPSSALAEAGLVQPDGSITLPAAAHNEAAQGAGSPDAAARAGSSGGVWAGGGSAGGMTAAEIAAAASRQAQAPASKVQQSAALTKEVASALTVQDYPRAYSVASEAIDLNPRNAQAWNYRAIADNKMERYADAVYDSSFALGLVPGNAAALQTRSWAFSKEGKYKEAVADADYTLEKEPDNAYAYQNRAFALAGMGDRDAAIAALKRSAELDPRFKDKYEQALQAPEKSDLLFLFNEQPGAKAGGAVPPAARRSRRFLRLILISMTGGILVALGILHIVSASWRERMRTTVRRLLGTGAGGGGAESAGPSLVTQYQIVRELGSGGMGVVYEAVDRSLGRRVAIKKMRDEIRADPAERRRFVTEARTVAALHHPSIVDIYSIIEDGQDVYLVFEHVEGKTLADLLREKGPLDFESARRILKGCCEAVEYAHRQKIIHRDVKPSNIMIAEDGAAKVMDFGVARQAKDAMTKMSMTNTVVGTPPYMAPEQEQGTVRKESDVFALGVCFYEMLSGKLPFSGVGAGMLLNKMQGRHTPLSQANVGLPAGLDAVLAKALFPDPEKRYRTPMEFLSAVEALSALKLG